MGYRQKWERANGPVPPGWHIHHKDGNRRNHALENLEAVPPHVHIERHIELGGYHTSGRLGHLAEIRPQTAAWHRSDEGRAWHRDHANRTLAALPKIDRTCAQCGATFQTIIRRANARFCSNACKSAWRRATGVDDEQRACSKCGKPFTVNRYSKQRLCSRQCGGRPPGR